MVDKAIFGSLVFGLQSTKEGFFGTKDLHGGGRILGQVDQRTRMGNQASSNKLPHHHGKIGGNRLHTIL